MPIRHPLLGPAVEAFPEDILKACDIRGVYPKPLGSREAERIGRATGVLVKTVSRGNIRVVVGSDVRQSSETLRKAIISGLRTSGMKVFDIGLASTPLLGYAVGSTDSAVGVMVTASHNPPEYNGFKFFLSDGPAPKDWIDRFYGVLREGKTRRGAGVVEKKIPLPDYRNALMRSLSLSLRKFPLVADLGNGAAAVTAPSVFNALGLQVKYLHQKMDPRYPGRGPDSSHAPALADLGEAVRKNNAALGVAFDGDGDRVAFVDDKGRPLPNDAALCMFARHYLGRAKGGKVVYDAKSFDYVETAVTEAGGTALLERAGHVCIHTRMRREGALLAGEASGHFFLPGGFPGDALYASLKFMEILKESGKPLSVHFDLFPARITSNDLKLPLNADGLPELSAKLEARARVLGAKVSTVDGVRAVFEGGWGIVRASVTEPVLSCRFEAGDRKALRKIVEDWFDELPDLRQKLLVRMNR